MDTLVQQLLKRYMNELLQDLDFTWREQDRFECPLWTEKLILHVYKKGTDNCVDEQLFVTSTSLSTGLIIIQSKHYKHWAAVEFPQWLTAVQNVNCASTKECDEINSTTGSTSSLHKFCKTIFGSSKQTLASSSVEVSEEEHAPTPLKDKVEPTCKTLGINQSPSQSHNLSPSWVHTIRHIQEKVSNLDRDLAEMHMNLEQISDQYLKV